MGALAPLSAWIPDDDLRLKKAVEDGASLESLAKGAVKFSRRFTVQELHDRWYSMLYDPIVSAEVSAYMLEFEPTTSNPSKFKISDDNNSVLGKRRPGSIRTSYYTMRKRISSEPFNPSDVSSLITSFNCNCTGNGNGAPSNCMLTDFDSNHHQFQRLGTDTINNGFSHTDCVSVGGIDGRASDKVHTGSDGNDFPIVNPDIFEDDFLVPEYPGIQELVQPEPNIFFEDDDSVPHNLSSLGQFDPDLRNELSEYGGNQVFNSSISDCDMSFQDSGCSSIPLNGVPIWRTMESISEPIDANVGDNNDQLMRNPFSLLNDDKDGINSIIPECDVNLDSKIKFEASHDEFESSTLKDIFFAELSDSLLNFTNEEELMFMNDKEDVLQKPYYIGLSSLLVNPNMDANKDEISEAPDSNDVHVSNSNEVEVSIAPDLDHVSPEGSGEHVKPFQRDGEIAHKSLVPNVDPQYPELGDGVISCSFNTEVLDIPCNDDVFPPDEFPSCSSEPQCFQEAMNPSSLSCNGISKIKKSNNACVVDPIKSNVRNCTRKPLSEKVHQLGVNHLFLDAQINHGKHFGLNKCSGVIAHGNPSQKSSVNEKVASGNLNGKNMTYLMANPYGRNNTSGNKLEQGMVDVSVQQPVVNTLTSDDEERLLDSDEEMPYFSDVEAMILDMDLSPDCPNAYFSKKGIEEVVKKILRLEQGAHSCIHRAIASHGALAVLYGRHSKHYIKKSEVLLGRATEEVDVDIDLRSEGLANKISRRQATIKLENKGCFNLTNHGQSPISVNGNALGCGQNVNLHSDCLILMRGMVFIFETNERCVKQYLKNIPKRKGISTQK